MPTTARAGLASMQIARTPWIRTAPVWRSLTGAQMPPGLPVGTMSLPPSNTPSRPRRFALDRRGAVHLERQVVCASGAERFGDVERVADEVALGVPDVDAVEPDVALVEDPVELEPRAATIAGGIECSKSRRYRTEVSFSNAGDSRPVPGTAKGSQASSTKSGE